MKISAFHRGREEAIDCYDRASALKPDFTDAHFNKGVALEAWGHFQDAATAYQGAQELGDVEALERMEGCRQRSNP